MPVAPPALSHPCPAEFPKRTLTIALLLARRPSWAVAKPWQQFGRADGNSAAPTAV